MAAFSNSPATPRADGGTSSAFHADAVSGPQPWSSDDVLHAAWDLFKIHWMPLSGATFIGIAMLSAAQGLAAALLGAMGPGPAVQLVGGLILLGVQATVLAGWSRLFLRTAQRQTPSLSAFVSGFRFVPAMLVAMVVSTVFTGLGLLLVIAPGIIIALGTCLYMFFVVDGDGAIDALKASFSATGEQKKALFLFLLVAFLLNVAGALALGVGLLVTVPVSFLALATIYVRLTGRHTPGSTLS